MKAYSNDLRERVAAACAEPGATQPAVAARFCVSVSFVEKLRQRQRANGSVAALPHRSGPAPLLDAAARAELAACLRQQPDASLAELCVWVAALGGPAVSPATLGRAIQALDWRRKK
uniref:helix-turn-helix domain-containing protein n=1 Tax=Hymenobacter terrenus TaxID=1629124 RepID=UPI000619E34D